MAGVHGKNGKLTVGATGVVAGVTKWRQAVKTDTTEVGAMGEGDDKSYEAGRRETTYDIEFNYVSDDADGQRALVDGAKVTFKLYPESDSSGKRYVTGSAIVEATNLDGPLDGKITGSATLRQTGAATWNTVAP
ncbi:MAG: hypothetical protein IKE60_34540 [Reyranella sp.]|uniref:hypothetical protein n=1 Tax=Reyranella sp. TaxID=1929291 RepID=UPI0025E44D4F|nr:hypothetical protein [Reyranella sp.]MBR2819840.1 hypothetical protein [Reyranella sp.]